MTGEVAFWILMLLWAVFSTGDGYWGEQRRWLGVGMNVLLFFLIGLLGWKLFGAPLK